MDRLRRGCVPRVAWPVVDPFAVNPPTAITTAAVGVDVRAVHLCGEPFWPLAVQPLRRPGPLRAQAPRQPTTRQQLQQQQQQQQQSIPWISWATVAAVGG